MDKMIEILANHVYDQLAPASPRDAACAGLGRRASIVSFCFSSGVTLSGLVGRPMAIPKYASDVQLFNVFVTHNTRYRVVRTYRWFSSISLRIATRTTRVPRELPYRDFDAVTPYSLKVNSHLASVSELEMGCS